MTSPLESAQRDHADEQARVVAAKINEALGAGTAKVRRSRSVPEARRQLLTLKSRWLEIQRRRAAGELVDAEVVRRRAFGIARTVRDSMLNIPARVAAEIAVTKDPKAVERLLEAAIRDATSVLDPIIAAGPEGKAGSV